jgi:hypothetical protein
LPANGGCFRKIELTAQRVKCDRLVHWEAKIRR